MALALLVCPMMAQADETNPTLDGYYRMINPVFDDAMIAHGRYDLGCDAILASNAGNIVYVKADELYSIVPEMQKLEQMSQNGEIDIMTFISMMQQLQTLNAWKTGSYPVKELRIQGVDYVEMAQHLSDYCDDAIEDFLNNDIDDIWANHQTDLMGMAIFTGIITPADYSTPESLRRWAENYLTQWRMVCDFGFYLHPQMTVPEGADENTPMVHTGGYYLVFRTPVWVGNLKKGQQWFNGWKIAEEGEGADQLDIWGSAKKRIMKAIEVDYPEGTPANEFVRFMLSGTEADMVYAVGEDESGELYCVPQPDVFGENGVTLTTEDLLKCTWAFDPVNEERPLYVNPTMQDATGDAYTTLCTDFAYELKNATAYYATAVAQNGEMTLQEVAGGKVPAQTPVVIKSQANVEVLPAAVPVMEEVAPLSGNVLKGTLHPMDCDQRVAALAVSDGKVLMNHGTTTVNANSAYYDGEVTLGIEQLQSERSERVMDLQGRLLTNDQAHGLRIVNGKKQMR